MGDFVKRTPSGLKEDKAVDSSSGSADAAKLVKLDGQGKLASNMLPPGVGEEDFEAEATEAIAAGEFVNVFDDGSGALFMRKADASNGRRAHGFVRSSVSDASVGTVFGGGYTNDQLTGLSRGETYYLATTAGGLDTQGPSSAANHIHQELGFAVSESALYFMPKDPIELVD